MKFRCAPGAMLTGLPREVAPIALFEQPTRVSMGSAGTAIVDTCRRLQLAPDRRAWEFLSIALGVVAADLGCQRRGSSDGWTRELEVEIAVDDPAFWNSQAQAVNQLLGFLTGDIWTLSFVGGGNVPAVPQRVAARPEAAVTLLSGGLDSLIGTLDRASEGLDLVAVSQVSAGDKAQQRAFAGGIGAGLFHVQLNHNARPPEGGERSQRSRSIVFIAFGVLAATALDRYKSGEEVTLFVPENGFISLNVPLTPARLGSLSTRTTHPFYMAQLQAVLRSAGLRVKLENPYQFKTKGEMMSECRNQALLQQHAAAATSCGRFARNGFQHCGRCLPCLIRRAAFRKWGRRDGTGYVHADLSKRDAAHRYFIDVRAAGIAVEAARRFGVERWAAGSLNSAQLGDLTQYLGVARRGLDELGAFLGAARAL